MYGGLGGPKSEVFLLSSPDGCGGRKIFFFFCLQPFPPSFPPPLAPEKFGREVGVGQNGGKAELFKKGKRKEKQKKREGGLRENVQKTPIDFFIKYHQIN